jgi:hypothetical protein
MNLTHLKTVGSGTVLPAAVMVPVNNIVIPHPPDDIIPQ